MTQFTKLFEPGRIGKLELKNRVIFPPILTACAREDGFISERQIDYYARRARSGVGLVFIEGAYSRSGGYPRRVRIDDDRFIPGLGRIVDAIHAAGAKAGLQLIVHRGKSDEIDPASASENEHPKTGVKARAVTVSDLRKLKDEFGEGATRVKEAGFDCIMIHGASGYLVTDFLSPRTNRRTDEYGGDTKERAKFALELVDAVRKKTGPGYPVIFRLTADELVEGGFGLIDAIIVSKLLEAAGVDAIDVVTGVTETFAYTAANMYIRRGHNVHLSEAIRKEVSIPVCVAGRISDPCLADGILKEGKADFVDMGRALIADPEFLQKASEGAVDDIRTCIACGRCLEAVLKPEPRADSIVCTVNPAVGREKEFETGLKPVVKKKRVLVIGGGPGGMEAAIIAAQRGHDVTLWEKESKLGGQLNLAVLPPKKEELDTFLKYLNRCLRQLKVTVKLQKEATPDAVSGFSPDAVVLAIGSKPLVPKINGIDKRKVASFKDVLSGKVEVGKRVAVIGGGLVGCETAAFLAARGGKVTVVEVLPELASEFLYFYADLLVQELQEKGVESFTGVKGEKITDGGLEIVDKHGKQVFIEADDIVVAIGSAADKTLSETIKDKVPEFYEVGDCVEARRMHEAVAEGATAGMRI